MIRCTNKTCAYCYDDACRAEDVEIGGGLNENLEYVTVCKSYKDWKEDNELVQRFLKTKEKKTNDGSL